MDNRHEVALDMARIYYNLSKEGLERLTSMLTIFKFDKGDMVLKEGEICKYMWFVHKGLVRQFYFKNGKDLTEHLSFENDLVVCIESFYQQEPTVLQVEVLEPTILYGIPYYMIVKAAEESCELGIFYRKILERSLIVSQKKANMLRFETAQDRYLILKKEQPEAFRRAPMHAIASLLQMSPETLSRVRTKDL